MPLAESLLKTVQSYTMVTQERLENLAAVCEYLNAHQIPGDFVECGTYKGGTAAIIAQHLNQTRHLWLYDSFEGLPDATEKDGNYAHEWVGKCVAAEEHVREVLQLVGVREEDFTIQKGWFESTFKQKLPQQVSLLHCDADWYDSVLLVLETFYPMIPVGGVIVLDDFGYWEGCREAFYEFCDRHNERPLLERIGTDQAFWIKGRVTNRVPIAELDQQTFPIPVLKGKLQEAEAELAQVKAQLAELQQTIAQTQTEIAAMHTSKFWKLRSQWFRLKRLIDPDAR